jgi:hypothetical protein
MKMREKQGLSWNEFIFIQKRSVYFWDDYPMTNEYLTINICKKRIKKQIALMFHDVYPLDIDKKLMLDNELLFILSVVDERWFCRKTDRKNITIFWTMQGRCLQNTGSTRPPFPR